MPSTSLLPSVLRTFVPLIVGALMSILLRLNDTVDSDAVTTMVTAAVTGAYYLIVRVLEYKVKPQFGWLLGYASQPVYTPTRDASGRFSSTRRVHGDAGDSIIYIIGVVAVVVLVVFALMALLGRA